MIPNLFSISSNPANFVDVPQGAYAITHSESERHVLCTFNVVGCLVVTIYDRNKKKGALLHLDSFTKCAESIQKIMGKFNTHEKDALNLEAHIVGGTNEYFSPSVILMSVCFFDFKKVLKFPSK